MLMRVIAEIISRYRESQGLDRDHFLFAESVELSGYVLDKHLSLYKRWQLSDRQQCCRACSPPTDHPTKCYAPFW